MDSADIDLKTNLGYDHFKINITEEEIVFQEVTNEHYFIEPSKTNYFLNY